MYMVKEAAAYKKGAVKHLTENYLEQIHKFDTSALYRASYYFHFLKENLINEKFGTDKRVKSLYKTVDADNRQKITQDVVASAFGFNDSHIFEFTAKKLISNSHKIEIILCPIEVENL
mgnify:CR=1 FL=1